MTVLDLVQRAFARRALPTPATAIGNTEPLVARMVEALGETLRDLRTRYPYQMHAAFVVGADTKPKGDVPDLDNDEVALDAELVLSGMAWRFLETSGFDYAEPFRLHEERLARLACGETRMRGKGVVSL